MEKIIISFTSWKNRIKNCKHTFELMLSQTMQPHKIILNLSSDEFIDKEKELPQDLLEIVNKNDVCEIYWVKENTKPYKKLIPSLLRFPNDVIITIDDDLEYPKNFIEDMYNEYVSWGKECPIVASRYEWENGIYNHFGCYSLVKSEFFGKYIWDLYENLYLKNPDLFPFSDPLFTYAIILNGRRYKATESLDMDVFRKRAGQDKFSLSKLGDHDYVAKRDKEHELIRDYIFKKYGKTYQQLFEAPIYVNITTWRRRDKYLPKMLEYLSKQTKKPNKIILWLSKDEYDENNLPEHIVNCIKNGTLNEIRWVDRNIYCHKRHEIFKTNNEVYNLCMDDDLYYEPTYIETLYNASVKKPNAITSMSGSERVFDGYKIGRRSQRKDTPSVTNSFLGGLSCYPPYSFPIDSFNYTQIRDLYSTKCDETWVWCWCVKKGIKVNPLIYRINYKLNVIGDSDNSALWNEQKIVNIDGMSVKDIMLHNTIYHLGITEKVKKLYSNFKPYKIKDIGKNILGQMESEKIIVTMTSWKKRLTNLPIVIDSMLKQTKLPDKIVINLSSEELQNKEQDIPEDVLKYIKEHEIVEINWVDGPNTKQWKKIIPTMLKYPNDWTICIDDDMTYSSCLIETLWNKHLQYPNNPITINRGYKVNGYLQHCGCGTLECARFYNYFKDIDIEEIRKHTESSDTVYNYLLHKNGYKLIPIDGYVSSQTFNEIEPLRTTAKTGSTNEHIKIWNWLVNKYGPIGQPKQVSQTIQETDIVKKNATPLNLMESLYGNPDMV